MTDDWRLHATCRPPKIGPPIPTATFYPEKGESTLPARKICAICPVSDDCLTDSLVTIDRHGIRGGKSEKQRRAIRGLNRPMANLTCVICRRPFRSSNTRARACPADECRRAWRAKQQAESRLRNVAS